MTRRIRVSGGALLGLALLAWLLVGAAFGPALAPYDPLATDVMSRLQPPGAAHWFGTDALGRDLFSRVLVATRLDLGMAAGAVVLSLLAGSAIGAVCGFVGGALDRWVGRLVDVMMAFPLFVIAMALVAAWGNSVVNIVYATALINLPFYIRLARSEIGVRRHAGYVLAARLGGARAPRVLFGVLLPHVLPMLAVQGSINLGWALLNGAGLSFIGLGVRPPTPEWGVLVSEGAPYIITGQWWLAGFPGLALFAAVGCFALLGDALRDVLDRRGAAEAAP
ncbi:MAG: ABC transporter permease [Pseudomonadota bacterium]